METVYAEAAAKCLDQIIPSVEQIQKLIDQLKEMESREGISLLEIKNRDTIAYLRELVYIMWHMAHGISIEGIPSIERSVYLRTILERIRPLEEKLKPQIGKLLLNKSKAENNLRPRPEFLKFDENDGDKNSEEDSDDEEQDASTKKYIPPKVVAVHYNEDEIDEEEKRLEKAKKRALQSSLIRDLRSMYTDAPEEVKEFERNQRRRQHDAEKEKYEEDYMVRLQMSKKEKHNKRLQQRQNILDDLLEFGDYNALDRSDKPKTKGKSKPRRTVKKKDFKKSRMRGKSSRFKVS